MSYRIQYGPPQKGEPVKGQISKNTVRFIAFAALIAVVLFLLVSPQGAEAVRGFLLPGDGAVTEAAFSEFVGSIRGGESIGQAITAFCREIIEGASL